MALDISTARQDIAKLYIAAFNRVPDSTGLNFWVNSYLAGSTLASIANGFATSAEYAAKYPSFLTNTEYVASVYTNVFGRAVDTAGSTFWVDALNAGTLTKAGLLNSLVAAAAANSSTDGARLANQADFGIYCATNNIPFTSVASQLASITDATSSVAAAEAAIVTNEAAYSHVLTAAQDILTGTASAENFRAVAGNTTGTQDQTTLNSSDIIDGGAGADTMIVNLVGGSYAGGARIKNIETLKIGTNDTVARAFDYNVNQGSNEITEVTKIVADQINTGETLSVNNVLKTSGALPTLAWENDSNTAVAGTVNYNYRAAELTGTADNQAVNLSKVTNGVLNLAAGIETVTITSGIAGSVTNTERVTLNNSANTDTTGTGTPFNNAADIVSNGTLTKVVLNGTAEIGKAADIIAATGLTDRTVLSDTGSGATTQSNLLSAESRVTEVDASAATAAVNVRFVNKSDNTAQDVTFKGGSANDYVEFELGNITATGGAGDDTFAFITTAAGTTNATFGAGDNISGGEGSDTIQLGLNGAGTYVTSATEFNLKTGIETLDLRGNSNTVTLSDAFAAGGSTTLTVRTDKIQQTSSASVANPSGSNVEENSVTVLNMTELAQNRALNYVGGAGSDRLVLDDASFNQYVTLAGGAHYTNGTATTGDFDTLTVVDSAVIDRTDLANVSGFEGLVLSKNAANSQVRIELTQAFMTANTSATNDGTKTAAHDDTIFTIATVAAGNASALTAGDTVTIDVSDLLNAARTGVATAIAGRELDITSLTNAGVTVNYVVDGITYSTTNVANGTAPAGGTTAAAAAILTTVNSSTTTADGGLAEVTGSAGLVSATNGLTLTSNGVAAASLIGSTNNDTATLTLGDTVQLGAGDDTVNFNTGSAAATVNDSTGNDTYHVNIDITATATIADGAGTDIMNITADQGAGAIPGTGIETVNFTTTAQTGATTFGAGTGTTVTASVGLMNLTMSNGGTFTGSGTVAQTVTGSTTASTITFNGSGNDTAVMGVTAISDIVNLNSGSDTVSWASSVGGDTITGFTVGTGGDVLKFVDTANLALAAAATKSFLSGTAAAVGAAALDAANINVLVITGTGYANNASLNAALQAAGATEADGVVVTYFNTTDNAVRVIYDIDLTDTGDEVTMATLSGLSLTDLASLNTNNFVIA